MRDVSRLADGITGTLHPTLVTVRWSPCRPMPPMQKTGLAPQFALMCCRVNSRYSKAKYQVNVLTLTGDQLTIDACVGNSMSELAMQTHVMLAMQNMVLDFEKPVQGIELCRVDRPTTAYFVDMHGELLSGLIPPFEECLPQQPWTLVACRQLEEYIP